MTNYKPFNARKEAAMHDVEEMQKLALASIDQVIFCCEKLAVLMGVSTTHEVATTALENICCRVDDLPMDIENILCDATGDEE